MAELGALGGYIAQPLPFASSVTIAATSTNATPNITMTFRFYRVGRLVTMQSQTLAGATFTAASNPTFTSVIPLEFRPLNAPVLGEIHAPIRAQSGGSVGTGVVKVNGLGTIEFIGAVNSTSFAIGVAQIAPFSMSWSQ
jgi:hypothetical protein